MKKVTQLLLLLLQYSYIHYFILSISFLICRHFNESEILQVRFAKVFCNMGSHAERKGTTVLGIMQ